MTIIVDPWISGIAVGWLLFCAVCCVGGALRLGYAVLVRWIKRRKAEKLQRQVAAILRIMADKGIKFDPTFVYRYGRGPTRLMDAWTPEDIEGLKSYSLKGVAAKYLEETDRSYWQARADQFMAAYHPRHDWRAPESALAWGAIFREEGKHGMAIHVQSANGHIIMDTTEWWMLQEIRRDWYKSPGGFVEMYGDVVLFPETLKLFPRYVMSPRIWEPPLTMPPILRYLRPTGNPPHPDAIEMWRWNVTRQEWEVWDENETP